MGDLAFRRSPHVVTFWLRGEHLIFNYATGVVVRGSSLAMEVLDSLGKWKTWDTLSKSRSREERRLLRRLVDLMVRRTFVTRSDESRDIDKRVSAWRTWNPAAGFFHFATKDVRYRFEVGQTSVETRIEGRTRRAPPPLKTEYRGGMRLPPARLTGEVPSLLLARRTWRTFGRQPITLTELATLAPAHLGRSRLDPGARRWPHCAQDVAVRRSAAQHRGLRARAQGREPRAGLYHYHPDHSPAWPVSAGAAARQVTDYFLASIGTRTPARSS